MATVIGVVGESGHGKTTSAMYLDPKKTVYIDADKKGLNWKGWKKHYNEKSKNYYKESHPAKVWSFLKAISARRPEVNTVVVDTVNGIMLDDEFRRMAEKGYDKWQDLAASVYCMIRDSHELRDDLIIVYMFHSETVTEDDGYRLSRILTGGKKLAKIKLESKLTTVLFSKKSGEEYVFETQANKSTAKSPKDLFPDLEIPNNLKLVTDAIREYETN